MKTVRMILLSIMVCLIAVNLVSAQQWQTVYETDFSTDPGWTTNSSSDFYWDATDSTLYAKQININYSGNYATYDAGYDGGSFLLEWDVLMTSSQYASGLTFGLCDPDRNTNSLPSYVHITFGLGDQGGVTTLEWSGAAYGAVVASSPSWSLETWYHVVVEYNDNDNTMTAELTYRETGLTFVSLYGSNVGPFATDMGLIGSSNIREGTYQVPGAYFEGKFDNVMYSLTANEECWLTVYSEDFSADPTWETDDSTRFYRDATTETYFTDNYTNSQNWAMTDLTYNGESFRLRFDVLPVQEPGETGDMNVGLFGPTRISNSSNTEERVKVGFGGYYDAVYIDGHGADGEHFSTHPGSWLMQSGEWHHVEIVYDSESKLLSMLVDIGGSTVVDWTYTMSSGFSSNLMYLGASMVGSWSQSNRHITANVDNVEFATVCGSQSVAFDIKPGSCPNPLNVKGGRMDDAESRWGSTMAAGGRVDPAVNGGERGKKAVLPVAILGTAEFDVALIDATTVVLAGVSPIRWNYEDVATPVSDDAEECECNDYGPDGLVDLTMKFDRAAIIATLGEVNDGDVITLMISGQLLDGTPFEGVDCVVIRAGGNGHVADDSELHDDDAAMAGMNNFPNPFNPMTTISFSLPVASDATLIVYNVMGQTVSTVVDGFYEAGVHTVEWDGSSVASGVYFYRLETDAFTETKKMLLLK